MKKTGLLSIGIFVAFWMIISEVNAQGLKSNIKIRFHQFQVSWVAVVDAKSPDVYIGQLEWNIPKNFISAGDYSIRFHGTEKDGVYFAIRQLPNKHFESFGLGKKLLESSKNRNEAVRIIGELDFQSPYVIKKSGDSFDVIPYTETTELIKLFEVLDQWLYRRIIPSIKGEPYHSLLFEKTDYEMGSAITFPSRKQWRWKDNSINLVDN